MTRLIKSYAQLMRHPDPHVSDAASRAWARWEQSHVALDAGGFQHDPRFDDDEFRHVFATLTTHYWAHDGFLDSPLLRRTDDLTHLPVVLAHSMRDVSSPLVTAWRLHQRLPRSRLIIDDGGGHAPDTLMQRWVTGTARLVEEVHPVGSRNKSP